MASAGFAPAGVVFVAKDVDKFIRKFGLVNKTVERFTKNIGDSVKTWNAFETQLGRLGSGVISGVTTSVLALVTAIGLVAVAGVSTAASFENAFADVTKTVDAFVDRTATAESGIIQLTEEGAAFRQELMDLSEVIPVTFEELSAIAGLGGQLGIVNELAGEEAKEALVSFSETVAGLAEATNLTQEKAATGLAQISNIYRGSIDDIGENIERLGATIVELGNTSATTESLILNFAQRIAGAGRTVGLSQAEVLGIGTAFASIGITAEAGSTAVNRALLIINEAVSNSTNEFIDNTTAIEDTQDQISDLNADLVRLEAQTGITGQSLLDQREAFLESGGAAEDFGRQLGDARREQLFQTATAIQDLTEQLTDLSSTHGLEATTEVFDELLRVVQNTEKGMELTAEGFRDMFRENPAEAFTLFIEGLAEEGERAGEVLDEIGLGSVEATRAFLAIAGASDTVRDRFAVATQAFKDNSALTEEVSIRYATLVSRMKTFQNTIRNVAVNIFDVLVPSLIRIIDEGKEIAQVFGDRVPTILQSLATKFGPLIADIFSGFDLSGLDVSEALGGALDRINGAINAIDLSPFEGAVAVIRDTIVPAFVKAIDFAKDNTDLFIGAIKGIITILSGAAFVSAVRKFTLTLGLLNTPLGVATIAAIGLGIAWETNFLNIQEVTAGVVESVKDSLSKLVEAFEGFELPSLFPEGPIVGGDEMVTPEGFVISGDLIGIEPKAITDLKNFGEAILTFIGNLTAFSFDAIINKFVALTDIIKGFFQIGEGITADQLPLAKTLAGIEQVINGFVDLVAAPFRALSDTFNLEDIFGDLEFQGLRDFLFQGARDLVEGLIEGFTGTEVGDLGESITGLFESLESLGTSSLVTTIIENWAPLSESLGNLFTAINNLVSSFKELIGLEPNDSLLKLLGLIAGTIAGIAVDQLIAAVDALTGFITVLSGIANLDTAQITEGLNIISEAAFDFLSAPFVRFGERVAPELKLQMAQLALDGLASFQENIDKGFVTLETGSNLSKWIEDFSTSISDGINSAITGIQDAAAINLDIEDFIDVEALDDSITTWLDELSAKFTLSTLEFSLNVLAKLPNLEELDASIAAWFVGIDDNITTWLDNISLRFVETLRGVWDGIDLGMPSGFGFAMSLAEIRQQVKDSITGIWSDVDLGIPSFENLVTKVKEVADKIKGFFTGLFDGIDFEIPDFGIMDKLSELGLIDLGVETPDTDGLGDDLTSGLIDEVESAEQSWQDAWLEFLLTPIEVGKEALGVKSPSTVTEEMAKDVIEGYALGLSDLTPIEESILGIDNMILRAFQNLNTELLTNTIPTIKETDRVFVAFYSDTLSQTIYTINDELIPAKLELTEVNINDLVPSIDMVIEAEEELSETFLDVKDDLERLILVKEKAKERSKALVKQIDLLAKSYLALAEAIGAASRAGDGLTTAPTAPITEPGIPFQTGGSFIVPSTVGVEGLPLRVHAGELVQVIPAHIVPQLSASLRDLPLQSLKTSVMEPSISGASINNAVDESTTNNDNTKEFHLHVVEAPSTDVRDSFDILEALL